MPSANQPLWEANRTEWEVKAENQKKYKKPAVSEVQQLVLNCNDYFRKWIPNKYDATTETAKALKLPKGTIQMLDVAGLVIWSLFIWFQCFVVAQLLIVLVEKQIFKIIIISCPLAKLTDVVYYKWMTLTTLFMNGLTFHRRK